MFEQIGKGLIAIAIVLATIAIYEGFRAWFRFSIKVLKTEDTEEYDGYNGYSDGDKDLAVFLILFPLAAITTVIVLVYFVL